MAVPVITVAQMRQWEQSSWDAGCSQAEVIGRAGEAVARVALAMTQRGDEILILAGKGHNGDDARCAQPHLAQRTVRVLNVRDPATDLERISEALRARPALVVDGLFGIGLSRPLEGGWAQLIEQINRAALRILAVDVPSGLNADTGEPQNVAVCAHRTVTFGAPKRGLLLQGSYPFVGRLEVAREIGLSACPFKEELQWSELGDFADYPPTRRVDGHKGTFGHAAIAAGSEGYHGAAVLAARGALRARPGLVSLFVDARVYTPVASQLQAAMVHPFKSPLQLPGTCTSIVIGPGLAASDLDPAWKKLVNDQWQNSSLAVVVDASALEWIEKGPTPLNSRRVLTPHPGEAARLLGTKADVVQGNRVAALRELSSRYGNCWIVLKGHQTLVGRSSGEVFVNPTGNPYLAQGGAGDVLSGFIGGLLAQPKLQAQPLQAIRYAVWEHGATADRLTMNGENWTIEEFVSRLG
jgi:hydroxyethylthiazole kinase-like uncharacterized protein yjeF